MVTVETLRKTAFTKPLVLRGARSTVAETAACGGTPQKPIDTPRDATAFALHHRVRSSRSDQSAHHRHDACVSCHRPNLWQIADQHQTASIARESLAKQDLRMPHRDQCALTQIMQLNAMSHSLLSFSPVVGRAPLIHEAISMRGFPSGCTTRTSSDPREVAICTVALSIRTAPGASEAPSITIASWILRRLPRNNDQAPPKRISREMCSAESDQSIHNSAGSIFLRMLTHPAVQRVHANHRATDQAEVVFQPPSMCCVFHQLS